ncbi:hypothetical protein ABWR62_12470 [Enterococcus faecium]
MISLIPLCCLTIGVPMSVNPYNLVISDAIVVGMALQEAAS